MPKLVDHGAQRRQIALSACRALARKGVDRTTMVDIAREAAVTTGMITYYFRSKSDIIAAALRLVFERTEARIEALIQDGEDRLYSILKESLPIDATRRDECSVWVSFWGKVSTDPKLAAVNRAVHDDAVDLYARAIRAAWPESRLWSRDTFDNAHALTLNFLNGLTASAVTSPRAWPVERQLDALALQLGLIRRWAKQQTNRGRRSGYSPQ
ncbi:MAG: TetR family transcriptional regulator [Proteobacteria bacterium]|nr:MAG: TetR family transcriptional regulator [Pseudomonadota bacterium]